MTRDSIHETAFGLAIVAFLTGFVAIVGGSRTVAGLFALAVVALFALAWFTVPVDNADDNDDGACPECGWPLPGDDCPVCEFVDNQPGGEQ